MQIERSDAVDEECLMCTLFSMTRSKGTEATDSLGRSVLATAHELFELQVLSGEWEAAV